MVSKIKRCLAAFLMLVLIIGLLPSINASAATTQTGILLFDYSDNGDYTSRLNSQIAVTYKPNGTGSTKTAYIKNLGWHFARYGNVAYADDPLYCIEPYRNYGASTSGNSVDRDVTVSGSGSTTGSSVWYALPENRREAIGLILLYSDQMWDDSVSVTTTKKDSNPNVPLRVATQFLIYEIVCGLRDANTFTLNSTNESGTAGDIFYNSGAAAISDFAPNYNTLVSNIQAAMKHPSFTGNSSSGAPTITLTGDETSVYDSNGVLSNWSFTDGSGAEFYKSGNTLYITQTGTISESTAFKATRSVPSAYNSSFNLWYMSGSTYQTTISLASASTGTAYAYFKLDPPSAATLSITKTTEDGTNLQGWQFGIYSDSACTNLLSGPHTTDSSGNITVSDLSTATVYVKEIGHSDSAINGKYTCESTNPQKVTLTAGQTSTVSFHNKLKTGSVKLVKETNTGENLGGWQIGLYYDSACTNAVSGSPFTTASDGTITVNGLLPGTLYAKESPVDDPYWQMDSSIKTVTVATDQTATVTFSNTHLGRIKFQKTTNTGNQLGGWTFRVKDSEYNIVGEYTTDASGVAYSDYLTPGRYTVIELSTEDLYWNCEFGFHDVTVAGGEDVVDEWLNREQGLGWFYKQTNTDESVDGWHITVYADEACTQELYTVITNEDGRAGYYMDPGIYWAKETGDEYGRFESEYWMVDESVQQFEIKPHEDTAVYFTNVQYGGIQIVKYMDGEGSASGWQFKVTDADGEVIAGSPFTSDENGEMKIGNVLPGAYIIEEIIPEDSLYYCTSENPQTVTVTAGETAQVSFTNAMRTGSITIEKVDSRGEHLAGAKFLLEWSEDGSLWWPIEYSETLGEGKCSNPNIEDGCLTSGKDGLLEWADLHPGLQYRVTELEAPDGYTLLSEPAFEGKLPSEELTVSLRVVNCEIFTLPQTGSSTAAFFRISQMLCICVCSILLIHFYRKERK